MGIVNAAFSDIIEASKRKGGERLSMEFWNALDIVQKALFTIAVPSTLLLVVEFVMLLAGLAGGHGDVDGVGDDADIDAPDADLSDMDVSDVDADLTDIDVSDGLPDMDASDTGGMRDMDGMDLPDVDDIHPQAYDEPNAAGRASGELRWFTLLGVLSFLAITGWAGLALIEAALPAVLAIGVALGLGVLAMYLCAVVMRSFKRMGAQGNLNVVNARGMFAEAYMPIPAHRAGIGKVTLTMQGRFVELDAVTDDGKDIPTGARVVVMGEVDSGTVLVRAARK